MASGWTSDLEATIEKLRLILRGSWGPLQGSPHQHMYRPLGSDRVAIPYFSYRAAPYINTSDSVNKLMLRA